MLTGDALTGTSREHIVELDAPRCALHRDVVEPWLELRAAAARDGFELHAISSFRDFERQLGIWNAKYRGEKQLYDRRGLPLDYATLRPEELVDTIMTWSALPGASRHHWGTDLDVICRRALQIERQRNPDFHAQMMPAEFEPGALFGPLEAWLSANLARCGFFRPYARDEGGVMPEPWHISFAPVSVPALAAFDTAQLTRTLQMQPIAGRDEILARLPELVERYVRRVAAPLWLTA